MSFSQADRGDFTESRSQNSRKTAYKSNLTTRDPINIKHKQQFNDFDQQSWISKRSSRLSNEGMKNQTAPGRPKKEQVHSRNPSISQDKNKFESQSLGLKGSSGQPYTNPFSKPKNPKNLIQTFNKQNQPDIYPFNQSQSFSATMPRNGAYDQETFSSRAASNQRTNGFQSKFSSQQESYNYLAPDQISHMTTDEIIQMAKEKSRINQTAILDHQQDNSADISDYTPTHYSQYGNYQGKKNYNYNLIKSLKNKTQDNSQVVIGYQVQTNQKLNIKQIKQGQDDQNKMILKNKGGSKGTGMKIGSQVVKPTETYEKVIENKVFSFLNGFFNKGQNKDQPSNSHSRNVVSIGDTRDFSQQQRHHNNFSINQQYSTNSPMPSQQFQPPQRSLSPIFFEKPQYQTFDFNNELTQSQEALSSISNINKHDQQDIAYLRITTDNLRSEMRSMKKFVEDLQFSLNEKEAEIIKLNMKLGDEKKKIQQLNHGQSMMGSSSSLFKKSPESTLAGNTISGRDIYKNEEYLQLKDENTSLVQEIQQLKAQMSEMNRKNREDMELMEKAREDQKNRHEEHTKKLEGFLRDIRKEQKIQEDEVERAAKTLRLNDKLQKENEGLKSKLERIQEVHQRELDLKEDEIFKLSEKLSSIQEVVERSKKAFKDEICQNCVANIQEKEEVIKMVEQYKRQIDKLKKDHDTMRLIEEKHAQHSDQNQLLITNLEKKMQKEIDAALKEVKEKEKVIEKLEKQLSSDGSQNVKKMQQMEAELEELKKQRDKAKKEFDTNQVIQQLQMQVEKFANQFMETQTKEAQMLQEIEKYKEVIKNYKDYTKELEDQLDQSEESPKKNSKGKKNKK